MKINIKNYLEQNFEAYKTTLNSLDLSKEEIIQYTF